MNDCEYLFPKALRVTASGIARVLMIGSCQTAQIHYFLSEAHPEIEFSYIVSNYVGDLPSTDQAKEYDIALIQFPLRSIITDHVVWFGRLADPEYCSRVLNTAIETLTAMYDAAVCHAAKSSSMTFVSNFILPQSAVVSSLAARGTDADLKRIVTSINNHLRAMILKDDRCILLDADSLASVVGKRFILDDDVSFYGHNALKIASWSSLEPHGLAIQAIPSIEDFYPSKESVFSELLYQQMEHDFRVERQLDQVKAVIFDLDNTLWRGQIAEHYRDDAGPWPQSDTWPMGVWEAIHHLKSRGILVSICSKNDLEVVERQWGRPMSPAFLQLADFVSPMINWAPKSDNIIEITSRLNIKPKSVVFVDDNPVEREAVTHHLPDIRTLGENIWLIRRTLLWSAETQVRTLTPESRQRDDLIRRQIARDTERNNFSRTEFLHRLSSKIKFLDAEGFKNHRARIIELINKTNQFNTTGVRWTMESLLHLIATGGQAFAFEVNDRYADYGIVGVILVKNQRIEQFVMSCRIMGMDLEIAALSCIIEVLRKEGSLAVEAIVKTTTDNTPCRTLFERAGFLQTGENDDEAIFQLDCDRLPTKVSHVGLTPPNARMDLAF